MNLLSDDGHPLQALADLLTIRQDVRRARRAARSPGSATATTWPASLALGAGHAGHGACASPARPATARPTPTSTALAASGGDRRAHRTGPPRRSTGADVVYTDVWTRWARRTRPTAPAQAFEGLPGRRAADGRRRAARASSCTACPAHRGEEVTAAVVDGPQQPRSGRRPTNRMHAARGLLAWLLEQPMTRATTGDGRRELAQAAAPAPASPSCSSSTRSPARPSSSSCWPPRACAPPRPPCRRDLEDLGAIKVRVAGRRDASTPSPSCPKEQRRARRTTSAGCSATGWSRWRTRATSSCCAPRPARPTSSARPSTGPALPDVLGTVAGDDTLIVVVAEERRRRGRGRAPARPRRALMPRPQRPNQTEPAREPTRKKAHMAKRVVLAYSGGLDTSVAVRWMIEELGVEVIALRRRRRPGGRATGRSCRSGRCAAGAIEAIVVDAQRGVRRRLRARPALKANALYEGRYPLVSALSRPGDREAPRRGGPLPRRRRRGPRLHRQGQRPGALRGVDPGARPRPRGASRPVRDWGMTREDSILYAYATTSRSRRRRRRCTRSTTTSGAGPSSAARWRTRGPSRPQGVWLLTKPTADRAASTSSSASSAGVPRRLDGEPLGVLDVDQPAERRSSAPTAGAASTWSRTGGSASRAARPTSARPAWP